MIYHLEFESNLSAWQWLSDRSALEKCSYSLT